MDKGRARQIGFISAAIILAAGLGAFFGDSRSNVVLHNPEFEVLSAQYFAGTNRTLLVDDHTFLKHKLGAFLKKFRSSKWARTKAYSLDRHRDHHGSVARHSFWVHYSGDLPDGGLTNVLALLIDQRGNALELEKQAWSRYSPTREHGTCWILENKAATINTDYTLRLKSGSNGELLADIRIGQLKELRRRHSRQRIEGL